MNRTSDLFDDRTADWLEDAPVKAPAQLLDTVLAAVPSVPQRRAGDAWRPASLPRLWQLAAAAVGVLFISLMGALILNPPSVGPRSSPNGSGLTNHVQVPLHFYSISLP